LVNMPMSAVQRPSIALGTLSALLKKAGLRVKTLYANMWFAEYFGMETHKAMALTLPQHLVCEWLFSNSAFADHHVDDDAFFEGIENEYTGIDLQTRIPDWPAFKKLALETKAAIPVYLDWVAAHIHSADPAIVACSSIFQQNVASLALLRKIKQTNPDIVTMMGGANCETIMGKTLHEHFTWLDYVASGEVDTFIGEFCRQVLTQGTEILAADLPEGMFGPVHRSLGYPHSCRSYDTVPRAMTSSLDQLPPPDYDDYFAELKGNYLSKLIVPALPFEGARGCWWGAKSHCTFCGLNGVGMNFREKSANQLEAELDHLCTRYAINNFSAVDNILSLNHMKHFLPRLENSGKRHLLFYETR
ncbi:MAG: RiPP maturation radical SAM protein 1, partial [Aestuariibacter sp.]|nr:RiPP maturation radical SAM protein 1 [Aestuariibacter sp.]